VGGGAVIDIKVTGLQDLQRDLQDFSERRLRAAAATALTRTAVQMRRELQEQVSQVFDRPTPYTLRQLRYVGATGQRLSAAIGFNVVAITDEQGSVIRYADLGPGETPAGRYLTPNIDGGSRRAKRVEEALRAIGALPQGWFAVPAQGANIDAFGNITRGQIQQILSQLRVQLLSGTNRTMSFNARQQIAAQRKAGGRFFVMPVGGKTQPGVYQRELTGRNITPVLIFVRSANYRRRWDFNRQAREIADRELPRQMDRAIGESLQRLRSRGASGG
jgi:hypothetical protein